MPFEYALLSRKPHLAKPVRRLLIFGIPANINSQLAGDTDTPSDIVQSRKEEYSEWQTAALRVAEMLLSDSEEERLFAFQAIYSVITSHDSATDPLVWLIRVTTGNFGKFKATGRMSDMLVFPMLEHLAVWAKRQQSHPDWNPHILSFHKTLTSLCKDRAGMINIQMNIMSQIESTKNV